VAEGTEIAPADPLPDPLWRQLTTGALIIIAVSIDQWIRRVSS